MSQFANFYTFQSRSPSPMINLQSKQGLSQANQKTYTQLESRIPFFKTNKFLRLDKQKAFNTNDTSKMIEEEDKENNQNIFNKHSPRLNETLSNKSSCRYIDKYKDNDLSQRFCENIDYLDEIQKLQQQSVQEIHNDSDDDVLIDSIKKENTPSAIYNEQGQVKITEFKSVGIQAFESCQQEKLEQFVQQNKLIMKQQEEEKVNKLQIETNIMNKMEVESLCSNRSRLMTDDLDSFRSQIPTPKYFTKKISFLLYKQQLEYGYK